MAERIYLADAPLNGTHLDGPFAISNCQLGTTKAGKPFLKAILSDKSGRAPLRKWSTDQAEFDKLPTDGFAWVRGVTQPYQGELQVIATAIDPYEPSDRELAELMPSSKENINAMFAQVTGLLQSLEHPDVQALASAYLSDGELMDAFCSAPAAQMLHHAYLGGLLEHTRNMMRLADTVCPLYPQISRDIVLFGVFLHDLGKCLELKWRHGFGYTTDGQLVGHIVRGVVMLRDKARTCVNADTGEAIQVSEEILLCLEHIIASHHGVPEFGAAKIPATPEAIMVHYLDNIDAKMNIALPLCRDEKLAKPEDLGGSFTEKIWALDTRLYRPDPTKMASPAAVS